METAKKDRRDQFVQIVRGVSMICVVLIHSKTGMQSNGAEQVYWVLLRQFINFAVPIFFFISGYYAQKTLRKTGGGYWKRVKKLLIPYIIWSLFYIVIDGGLNKISASTIFKDFVFGLSSQQMYYIIVLIELTLITPLLIKASESKYRYLPLAISFIYLPFVYYQEFSFNEVHYAVGRNLIPWLLFYYIGLLASDRNIRVGRSKIIMACVMATALTIVEALLLLLMFNKPDFAASQLKVSSYLLAIAVILLEESLHKDNRSLSPNWLSAVGDCSYGIFYIHPFVIRLENAVARRIGFYDIPLPIYEVSQCIVTVVVCFATVVIIKKVDKDNKVRWLIGF